MTDNHRKMEDLIEKVRPDIQAVIDGSFITVDFDHEIPLERTIAEIRNASAKAAEQNATLRAVARVLKGRAEHAKAKWSQVYRGAQASAVVAAARDAEGRKARATDKANEAHGAELDKLASLITQVDSMLVQLEIAYKDLSNARTDLTNLTRLRTAQIRMEL